MAQPAKNTGNWDDLEDSDLKAAIEKNFPKGGQDPGAYFALKIDVTNPITGYCLVKNKTTGRAYSGS